MAIQYLGTTISGVSGDTKPTLTSNELGVIFVETDTDKIYQWDGDSWEVTTAGDATTSAKGVASFSSDNFAVSSGAVTIKNDGVILGTETTGNYVGTITAGTGITSTGATSGEGIAHSLSVDAAQTQITSVGALNVGSITSGFTSIDVGAGAITTTGTITAGNLSVTGTTTTVNSTNTTIADRLIELASGAGSSTADAGIIIERGSTGDNAIMAWDESADRFVFGTTTATGASTGDLTITTGTLVANLVGNVTGNASGTAATVTTAAQPAITSLGTQAANLNMGGSYTVYGWAELSGNSSNSARIIGNENASATNPTLVPDRSEEATGIGGTSTYVSTIVAGTERIRATTSGATVTGTVDTTGQITATVAGHPFMGKTSSRWGGINLQDNSSNNLFQVYPDDADLGGTKLVLSDAGTAKIVLDTDGTSSFSGGQISLDGNTIINNSSANADFQVKSQSNAYMIHMNANENNIGIGQYTELGWHTSYFVMGVGAAKNSIHSTRISNANDWFSINHNAYINTSASWTYQDDNSAGASNLYFYQGQIRARVASAGTAGNAITWKTGFNINERGQMSIGTNEPFLNMAGNSSFDQSTSIGQGLHIKDGNTHAQITLEGNPPSFTLVDLGGGSNDKYMQQRMDGGILKWYSADDSGSTVADNILVLDHGTGNVGIGIAPSYKLHVNGATYLAGDTYLNHTGNKIEAGASYNMISSNGYMRLQSNSSVYVALDQDNGGTDAVFAVRANGAGTNVFQVGEDGSTTVNGQLDMVGGEIKFSGSQNTIRTDAAYMRRNSATGDIHFDSQGSVRVNLDTNDNNTDKTFSVGANASTNNVFSVNENGAVSATGEITSTVANGWSIGNLTNTQRISNNSGTFSMLNSSNAWADVQMANLQINGKITAYNSAAVNINDRLNVTNNGSQSIWYAAGGIAIISDDNDNQTDSDIIFGTNSATTASGMDEMMRITDPDGTYGGNVGIGTATPDAQLEIEGSQMTGLKLNDTHASGNPRILLSATSGRVGYIRQQTAGANGVQANWYATNDANSRAFSIAASGGFGDSSALMMIMANGNMGLGIHNPSYALHVEKASGTTPRIYVKSNGSDDAVIDIDAARDVYLSFRRAGTTKWSITNNHAPGTDTLAIYNYVRNKNVMSFQMGGQANDVVTAIGCNPTSNWYEGNTVLMLGGHGVIFTGTSGAAGQSMWVGYNTEQRNSTFNAINEDEGSYMEQQNGNIMFKTAPSVTAGSAQTFTERFRIALAGQLGIGGANYGTDGQVLTSKGASAAPEWADAGGGDTLSWADYIGL